MAVVRILARHLNISSARPLSSSFCREPHRAGLGSSLLVCRAATPNRQPAASASTKAMTPQEKYLFDTLGYCVLRGALSPEEVSAANAAIDKHSQEILERNDPDIMLAQGSSTLKGNGRGRYDLGGMLGWPSPDNKVWLYSRDR